MHLTVLGIVILPFSLVWAFQPLRLVQLALIAAVFEAGAAVAIGGFGLPLAMVPGLLFIGYVVLQYAIGMRYAAEGRALLTLMPLLALLLYALLSVVLLPNLFAGRIMVWPQKADPIDPSFVPLTFTAGNITQTLYLAMNVTIAVVTALFLTRARIPYYTIIAAYLTAGYIAVGIAFWQFAARVVGIPFPDTVFFSNPGWAIVDQQMDGVPRIQGSFSEPAGLAFYLAGLCFCCLWLTARGCRVMNPSLLLMLAIMAMLISTSTTGIATVAVGLPIVLLLAGLGADTRAVGHLAKTVSILALSSTIAFAPVLILKPSILTSVNNVVTSTLTKRDSELYAARTGLDVAALATVGPTYGLGVGWGSFRTSSLIPGLLANAGVFGIVAVLWLLASVGRLVSTAGKLAPKHGARILVEGFAAALCGQLCAALMSAPTIGSLAFYLQLGCVVGAAARMCMEAQSTTSSRRKMVVAEKGIAAA